MFANMFKKVFGSKNDREIRKLGKTVVQINQLEAGLAALSDADLKAETLRLRGKLEDGSSLDQLLPEAFALVRETSNR
ncbi:MAG: hypothetical protein HOO18_01440, partial [Porticoccaceae bacterium]|nr:hypothetical protein [Porticoccaceae bacterium]